MVTKTYIFLLLFLFLFFKIEAEIHFPFSLSSNKDQIVIQGILENSSVNLLFDNGAPSCIFLNRITDTSNYKIIRKTYIIDPFGQKTSAWLAEIEKFEMGGKVFKNEYFILLKSNEVFNKLNLKGILGYNIINRFDWKFNFFTKQFLCSKKIRLKNEGEYYKLNTFIYKDRLQSIMNIVDSINSRDTCLIDFGYNLWVNSKNAYSSKGNYLYYGIHSTATGVGAKNGDTTFIFVPKKIEFQSKLCLVNFPVFSSSEKSTSAIGCRFFTLFDEIVIKNSDNGIYLKNKDTLILKIKKFNDFNNDNIITSIYQSKGENLPVSIGNNLIEKKIDKTQSIDFLISLCQ